MFMCAIFTLHAYSDSKLIQYKRGSLFMDISSPGNICIFDEIRLKFGIDKLKTYFLHLLKFDRKRAIDLINDNRLHFCSLFALQLEIMEYKLFDDLNLQCKSALDIVNGISTRKGTKTRNSIENYKQMSHSSMKWILETGSNDDGYSNQFDAILDSTAALLVKIIDDKSVLPILVHMIFNRHRKGLFYYDLLWTFFEARDPHSLFLIARNLSSSDLSDVELARKLLNFIPCINLGAAINNLRLYMLCQSWLYQNLPYLYYTGDNFRQTCNPIPYVISWEAKYLCKPVSPDTGKFIAPLSKEEKIFLEKFKTQSYNNRVILADYSFRVYHYNSSMWSIWLRYPIIDQIRMAGTIGGRLL